VLADKTYIGQRLDLQHYKGYPIIEYHLEVLDSNEDAFDFSNYDTFKFELFDKAHGASIETVDLDNPTGNIITINDESPEFLALRKKLYFYEVYCYTQDSPALKTLISYGVLDLTDI
jgi:hypothetical protein